MIKSTILEDGKSKQISTVRYEATGVLILAQHGDVITLTKNQIAALEIILVME